MDNEFITGERAARNDGEAYPLRMGDPAMASKFADGLVTRSCRRKRAKQLVIPEMHVPTDTRPSRFPLSVSYIVIFSWLPASVAGGWCCQMLMHLEHLSSLCKE